MKIEDLQHQIDQLQAQIDKLKEQGEEWPEDEDHYWYLGSDNVVWGDQWCSVSSDQRRFNAGNVFRTREDAHAEAMRREARAKKWKPKNEQSYFLVSKEFIIDVTWTDGVGDWLYYHSGNCHPSREAAEQWRDKYLQYFTKA